MINLFENITEELTDYEKEVILPVVIKGLETKNGKQNAVTNKYIVGKLSIIGISTSSPRIRKIIHYIRVENKISRLIATSNGYYISNNIDELDNYIKSLKQRLNSIRSVKDSLTEQRDIFFLNKSTTIKTK